eukprot:TRINITY_DN81291_c0_g1_i1.p1 TRINITY_DN81291_c0_g1~~TRINITY_DN81291_c0_g1_i1.p1  ORF type:complete len:509 (+),score=75.55 TRINITY_DN81291_c0_g1_i1:165-1691(+)
MSSDLELGAAPAATVLWIQKPGADSRGRASWEAVCKPGELQMLGEPEWQAFSGTVHRHVSRLRHEAPLFRPALYTLLLGLVGIILAPLIASQLAEAVADRRSAAPAPADDDVETPAAPRRTDATNMTYTWENRWACRSEERNAGRELDATLCKEMCAADPCCCGYTVHLNSWAYLRGAYRRTCEISTGDHCSEQNCEFSATTHFYFKDQEPVCDAAKEIEDVDSSVVTLAAVPGAFLIIVSVAFLLSSRFIIVRSNLGADRLLSKSCVELSESTGVSVQYISRCTDFLTARAATTSRAIIISKAASNDQHHQSQNLVQQLEVQQAVSPCASCQCAAACADGACSNCNAAVSVVATDSTADTNSHTNSAGDDAEQQPISVHLEEEPADFQIPPASFQDRPLFKPAPKGDFVVRLSVSSDRPRLGMRLEDVKDGLKVLEVLPDGLVALWNECRAPSPELVIETGDCILNVNGVFGDHDSMLAELALGSSSSEVCLEIKKCTGESQPQAAS